MLFAIRLGESQVKFSTALQAIEFTGVYGLDAMIALVNIMFFRVLYFLIDRKNKKMPVWPLSIAMVVVSTWFAYGLVLTPLWDKEIESWSKLKVGLVHPNETPSLETDILYPGYSRAYPPEMEMTERLAKAGAHVIAWPEARYKAYFDQENTQKAYQRQIRSLGTSLVFQDMQAISDPNNKAFSVQYNSAVMLDSNGVQSAQYKKIKRIPFGEYVPLVSDIPRLKHWVESFFGKFLNELSKGDTYTVFEHEKIDIIPLICYETTFSAFVAEAANYHINQSNSTKGHLLLGLSNNGWFGSTHQPYQHVFASVLRSVENRLPLVHVVNNGPSIVVTPNGTIIFESDFQRAGGYIVDVPYANSARGSFYSQHTHLFTNSVYILLLINTKPQIDTSSPIKCR